MSDAENTIPGRAGQAALAVEPRADVLALLLADVVAAEARALDDPHNVRLLRLFRAELDFLAGYCCGWRTVQ